MKISHEAPHSDLAFFVQAPLRLTFRDGQILDIREWNLSGVKKPDNIEIFPNQGDLRIPFQGVDIQFPVAFEPSDKGFFAFKDLTVRQRETLSVFYNSILSGRMASTSDMITSLDTPVDLVPMSETEEEKEKATQNTSPQIFRAIKALATYLAAALLIFGLLGQTLYSKATSIPALQARVLAPNVEHFATANAFLDRILIEPGDHVLQGEVLIRMSDPRRDGRLEDARRVVNAATKKLSASRDVLRQHDALADKELARLERELDIALRGQTGIAEKAQEAKIIRAFDRLVAFQDGISMEAGDHFDLRDKLIALRDQHKEDLRLAKRAVGIAKADARLLDIKAQADGIVTEVFALEDQHVARGTLLLQLEEQRPRTIVAVIDEKQAMDVVLGQNAKIRLNGLNGSVVGSGRVVDIAVFNETPLGFTENGFLATFEVAPELAHALVPNAPADVRVWRQWVPDWMRR